MLRRWAPAFPAVEFREGTRGYQLRVGSFAIPQGSYLLVAAVVVGFLGGFGAIAFRALITLEGTLAFGILQPALGRVVGAPNSPTRRRRSSVRSSLAGRRRVSRRPSTLLSAVFFSPAKSFSAISLHARSQRLWSRASSRR